MNPSIAFVVYSISLLCIAACLMVIIIRSLMGGEGQKREDLSTSPHSGMQIGIWFLATLLFGLLIGGYYVLRYHGLWTETDTATISLTIESIRRTGILMPKDYYYQHGFGYQANSITLLYFTGLITQTLQSIYYPFLACAGLVLISYIFFREVLRDPRAAILASMLLLFQPELMFVTLRGSHEKMTWPLIMLALIFLYRSIGQPLRKMTIYVILFYMVVFAIDTTNVFFGSVFLVAVVISMTLGFIFFRFWRKNQSPIPRQDVQRLMYVSMSGGILMFLFIVYVYPPVLTNLRMFRTILDQLSALLLSFEVKAQPYGYISTGWINSQVYLMLTIFTWMVIGISLLEWLRQGWRMVKGKAVQGLAENLDWLLYTGFAIQIAISIIVDLSGALSANMQLRVFPSFTVVAIVFLVRSFKRPLASRPWHATQRRILLGATAILSAWFALASVLKSTNEPSLSNKWAFYIPAEKASILWVDTHLIKAEIWTIVDERLPTVFNSFYRMDSQSENHFQYGRFAYDIRFILITEFDRIRSERLGLQLPPISYWDQIYDNGQAKVDRVPLFIMETP